MPSMEKDDLNNKTAEELFYDYLQTIYRLKPNGKQFDLLISALKDAFYAGLAIASVSEQDFKLELLAYAESAARDALASANLVDGNKLVN